MRHEIVITPVTSSLVEEPVCIMSCAEYPNGICITVAAVGQYVTKVLGDRNVANK